MLPGILLKCLHLGGFRLAPVLVEVVIAIFLKVSVDVRIDIDEVLEVPDFLFYLFSREVARMQERRQGVIVAGSDGADPIFFVCDGVVDVDCLLDLLVVLVAVFLGVGSRLQHNVDAFLLLLGMLCEFPQDVLSHLLAVVVGLDARLDLMEVALHDGLLELSDAIHRDDHRLIHVPAQAFDEVLAQGSILISPDFPFEVVVKAVVDFIYVLIFFLLSLSQGLHHELSLFAPNFPCRFEILLYFFDELLQHLEVLDDAAVSKDSGLSNPFDLDQPVVECLVEQLGFRLGSVKAIV